MLDVAPRSQVTIGRTTVTFLPDGEVHLDPVALFPLSGPDGWRAHAPYLDADGRLPVSVGSFLVRTPTHSVLVDLGLGDVDFEVPDMATFRGGLLLDSLAAEDLGPDDVDLVFFTHLHHDHVGWTSNLAPAPNAAPVEVTGLTFAGARHVVARAEWDRWKGTDELTGPHPAAVQDPLADVVELVDPIGGEGIEIVPGLRAVATPGHTPGHTSLLVTDPSTDERVLVVGDVMHSQVQISETSWSFLFDDDPAAGTRTRESLLAAHDDGRTIVAGGHFAGSVFGRVLPRRLAHGWAAHPVEAASSLE